MHVILLGSALSTHHCPSSTFIKQNPKLLFAEISPKQLPVQSPESNLIILRHPNETAFIIITHWLDNIWFCSNYVFIDFHITMQGLSLLKAQRENYIWTIIVFILYKNYLSQIKMNDQLRTIYYSLGIYNQNIYLLL